MSAPDTNVKDEEKKHKPALLGIKAVLVYVSVLLFAFLAWIFFQADDPEGAAVQIDGRTGQAVSTN